MAMNPLPPAMPPPPVPSEAPPSPGVPSALLKSSHYRIDFLATRDSGAGEIQLQEVTFYGDDAQKLNIRACVNPGGDQPINTAGQLIQHPDMLIDGNMGDKAQPAKSSSRQYLTATSTARTT